MSPYSTHILISKQFLNTLFKTHLFPVSQFCAMEGGRSTSQLSSLEPTTDRLADIYFLIDLLIYIFPFLDPPQLYLLISMFLFLLIPPNQDHKIFRAADITEDVSVLSEKGDLLCWVIMSHLSLEERKETLLQKAKHFLPI